MVFTIINQLLSFSAFSETTLDTHVSSMFYFIYVDLLGNVFYYVFLRESANNYITFSVYTILEVTI